MNNLATRTITGVVFCIVMIAGLYLSQYSYAALMLFILVTMMLEFYRMTMGEDYKVSRALAIAAAVILFCLVFCIRTFNWPGKFLGLAVIPVLVVMINSLYVKDKSEFGKFANVYTALLYFAAPISLTAFAAFNDAGDYNRTLLLCFFAIIWSSDIGAYCFGLTLGKKFPWKLFESISPKKSWVGAAGGFLMSLLVAMTLFWTGVLPFAWYHCLALGAIIDVFGVYGDLFESQWKRHYDVKDSGHIIPGHGGMMDRFDSTLFAIPAAVVYLSLFNLLV